MRESYQGHCNQAHCTGTLNCSATRQVVALATANDLHRIGGGTVS
jgi:hypothetical protein